MERVDNALPVFGSYRSFRKKMATSSTDVGGNVNGVFVHFFTKLVGAQIGYPTSNANNSDGIWVAIGGDSDETALWEKVDDRAPNDFDRMVAGDSPAAAVVLIKLTSMANPTGGSDVTTDINYRYKVQGHSGAAWTLDIKLIEGSPEVWSESITQVTGSADDDEWVEGTFTLTDTANITDWTDLYIEVTATVPGDGVQAGYCDADFFNIDSWKQEDDDTTDIFESLDADVPIDDTYVKSPTIETGESSEILLDLEDLTDPVVHDNHVITYRHKASAEKLNSKLELLEEGDVVASQEVTGVPTTYTLNTLTLTEDEAAEIKRYSNLKIRYTVSAKEDVGDTVTSSDYYPASEVGPTAGTWTPSAGTTWESVGNNADELVNADGPNTYITFRIDAADPETNKNHALSIIIKGDVASTNEMWVKLSQGSTQILDGDLNGAVPTGSLVNRWYLTTTTGFVTNTYTLSEDEAARITNYDILDLQLYTVNTGVTVTLQKCYFTTDTDSSGAGRVGFLSQVKWALPDEANVGVSLVNFSAPTQYRSSAGDLTEIYLGVPEDLWKVGTGSFSKVTRSASDYQVLATTAEYAPSWDFVSWGTDILATNYIDAVQKKSPTDTLFSDLIVTPSPGPKGRFIAVISNHVVLGKIKFTAAGGQVAGESDEVWWSGIDDSTDFDPDVVTQCDRQRLFNTPGEVTGLTSGAEYGFVFKRNSIYRMEWVGSPLVFNLSLIARNEGTKFPRSIVEVDNDVYFYGSGGFKVIRNGIDIESIGDGIITKTLVDEEYESLAAKIIPSDDTIQQEVIKESAIMGTYDALAGLIYWSVRLKGDSAFANSLLLCYNVKEGRWGLINDSTLLAAAISSLPVSKDIGNSLTRNLFGISMSGTTAEYFHFNSDDSYDVTFETKILSSGYIARSENYVGQNLTIDSIKPIFRGDPAYADPIISIQMEVADDELMLAAAIDTDTVTTDDANKDGWIPMSLVEGEFFRFTVTVPSVKFSSIKEFDGLQVRWSSGGSF